MSTKIVYLAHSRTRILNDAVFSILNLVHQGLADAEIEVIVGTDRPHNFQGLPVTIWAVSASDIAEWKGNIDFIHRTKAVFLAKVAEKFPRSNILYFDADTALKVNVDQLIYFLSAGKAVMHESEKTIVKAEMPVYRQVRDHIDPNSLNLPGLLHTEMFNAGVIGVPRNETSVFEEVINGVDRIYPSLRIHIVEQMLFSYFISQRVQIEDCSNMVLHWWGKGLNTGPLIEKFLESTAKMPIHERADAASRLVAELEQVPMNPSLGFIEKLKRSFRKRFS